ncbi:MAG: hypothetical protein WCT77_09610, partial [Bacteroidota bacterium]
MTKFYLLLAFAVLTVLLPNQLYADKCKDYLLLDGPEEIISFGLDSTHHWWALTAPYQNTYKLVIDGKHSDVYTDLSHLTFSPDGNRWAFFGHDNVQWNLVTNDTIVPLSADSVCEIRFSQDSKALVYSYLQGQNEVIELPRRKISVFNRFGSLFLNSNGTGFAFMGYRGNSLVININGWESPPYPNITPIGFWNDGKMLYAAYNGTSWEVFKNDEQITESYSKITDVQINLEGTVAAFIAVQNSGNYIGVCLSDEYYLPLVSKPYDWAGNLTLHPTLPMMAFLATHSTSTLIALNNTEYYG